MSFWQENYGFVKEVYEFRMKKYKEWMDNLESIVSKVLKPNVQYTFKEFKIIQDTLNSLCRDLEKEGMKDWLDMMLEKVSMRVSEEGASSKDKEFKKNEKIRLTALINRHDNLMPATKETQEKVEIYARCYSYGDDVVHITKTLEEMLHLSTKEIHPHCLKMVEEQNERAQRITSTLDTLEENYDMFLKRGQKLVKTPNCAPFMAPLIEKIENLWNDSNEKAKERVEMLSNAVRDWEKYDDMRAHIIEPCKKLEIELLTYKKIYDPFAAKEKFKQRKALWEDCKTRANDMFRNIQKCYTTIAMIAGDEKREFLDREVTEVDDKRNIIEKCEARMRELEEFNTHLLAAVKETRDLKKWSKATEQRLRDLYTFTGKSQEERVKENICIQEDSKKKLIQIKKLEFDYSRLLPADELLRSDVARTTMLEFSDMKQSVKKVCTEIEKEAGSISEFFTKVQDLCKAWDELQLITNTLMNAYIAIPQSTNPGISTLDSLFKRLRDVNDRKCQIVETM